MNQSQVIEWLSGMAEHEHLPIEELFDVYINARDERRTQTGSLKHLLTTDYELYDRLMQERTDYAVNKVREYIKGKRLM